MRKLLWCIPMIFLLTGCFAGVGAGDRAQELALQIRGELLQQGDYTAKVNITADYGQRVYQYALDVAAQGEETVLTITQPENIAGITARVKQEQSQLVYDDIVLETGPMDESGLTPVAALPALLDAAKSGYIAACALETDEEQSLLRIDCTDPEQPAGQGVETSLWFDIDTHAPVRGEISIDGFRAILCEFAQFTKGEEKPQ